MVSAAVIRTIAPTFAAALVGASLSLTPVPAEADGHKKMDQQEYGMSMKAELENVRERVRGLDGDSAVEQAWDEVTGDWGRLQLAAEDEWEAAKDEFESSWEALQDMLDDAN